MGVRARTISLIAVTSLVLWLAMASVAAVYGTQASNEADTRAANGVLDSSAAAVASELGRLVAVCGDWAPWDDTFYFLKRHNSAYIRSNLGSTTLSNLGVDFMVFTDSSGRIVYAGALDPTTRRQSALPSGLVRYLAAQPTVLHLSNRRTAVAGALSLREGSYLIAAQPITTSDFSAPPDGTLVTGYRVNEAILSKFEELTLRPMDLYSRTAPTLPADVLSARSSLVQPDSRLTAMSSDATISAYSIVAGIQGEPGLLMRVSVPRTTYAATRSGLISGGLAMALFGLVLVAMLGITLDRTVLRRLTMLGAAVRDVERSKDEDARVPVVGSDEIARLATGINSMLDELGQSQAEMAYLVEHDPLTGLYNRRHFERELQREIDEEARLGGGGAVLWFDLDHFKDINDSLGHAAGDELLRAFGRHLKDETRAYCTVARLGGDEFGMLIPHAEGPAAVVAATRLLEGFSSRTFAAGNHDLHVSASVGVALYPDHGRQTSELLAHADIAMYHAKANGGNQAVSYLVDDAWRSEMTDRLEAAERILAAMRNDRLLLVAQPIRGADGSGARCFELLLRLRDEEGNLSLPADFIPTAERLGLIRDIDRWVVRRAIRLLALAQGENGDVQFSVNLSGCAFSDASLLDLIRSEFEETGAPPERLIIEITETTTIANIAAAVAFIKALKKIGCRFSIDDFGSGASSYSYLKHLPVDFLKIDGSLVTGMGTDSADAHFVHAIVEMCHGLRIRTIAECVETGPVLDAIASTGVDFVQGYYVGMPELLEVYLGERFAESGHGAEAALHAGGAT